MNYVIWGAGKRGKRILGHVGFDRVMAFIDSNIDRVDSEYCGKKVISFKEYQEKFTDCIIIISCLYEDEVINRLKQNNIENYFLLSDCPGALQEPCSHDILKKYIINYINSDKKYILYGCTLYSVLMREWIEEELGISVNMVPHEGISSTLLKWLSTRLPEHCLCPLEDLEKEKADEILMTTEQGMDIIQKCVSPKTVMMNMYDCSDKIEEYYNPRIEEFKNIHQGKRCFIVATGPSLRIEDLNTLADNNEICISVNSIWRAFESTKWRPQYYLAVDGDGLCEFGDAVKNQNIPYLFFGDTNEKFWQENHKENYIKCHVVFETSQKKCPKFSEDFARKHYLGYTVTYSAMQLAVYMGFKEIYLLGVDFSHRGKNGENYEHFYKEDKLISVSREEYVLLAYEAAKRYSESNGIGIFNVTRGGNLEVFERIDFDSLF